jgi:hypothetical protein
MATKKLGYHLLAMSMGFAVMLIFIGLMNVSTALALGQAGAVTVPISQSVFQPPPPDDDDLVFIAFFTDSVNIPILDLLGNEIGEGTHGGEARCRRNHCNKMTQLLFNAEYEYNFTTRQLLDPIAASAVVGGAGTITYPDRTERFYFIATFQDNRDGTVWVRYDASRPEASFIIPRAPGWLDFRIVRREMNYFRVSKR